MKQTVMIGEEKKARSSGILPTILQLILNRKAGRNKEKSKPAPSPTEEPKLYLDAQNVKAQIIEFDIREIVRLPHGLDKNEWLCTKALSFFNNVNLLYGVLAGQFCTNEMCPSMMAPGNVIYQWHDDKGKKVKCSAPQYIEFSMVFAQKHIDDESVFPTKYGNVFPAEFESVIQRILRLLFQVLEHIYFAHYEQMTRLDLHHHLNTIFTHMVLFAQEFKLLEQKEISASLEDLKEALHISLSLSSNPASTSASTTSSSSTSTASNSQSSSNLNTNP
ncbi:MOB kinase activator 2-like [Lytechinus pictus]|uniref:MOB kinase activator 2-like n=1 Tax=Lytechinus pictus TaxID=7653 RepID=UPI00240CFED2|nr:MOB kinase activator 2-like [Lytechinus pictus]